ncbi:MAG: YncE family protein [Terriglobia bacterium]
MRPAFLLLAVSLFFFSSCSRRPAFLPKPYLAFVASHGGRSVVVVDLANFRRLRTIPLPFRPLQIDVPPHARELAVTSDDGKLAVINFPGLRVIKVIEAGSGLIDLAFRGRAEAIASSDHQLMVFALPKWRLVRQFALSSPLAHVALTPDGKVLIGEDKVNSKLDFINPADGRLVGTTPLGDKPGSMVVLRRKIFLANQGQDSVTAVDLASRGILSRIEIAAPPTLLALKPDGGEVFAFSAESPLATILDTFHDSVEQTLPAGKQPAAAIFTANSDSLYIANAGEGTVTLINVANRKVLASVCVGIRPDALALTPDERLLAVTDKAAGSLAVMRAQPLGLLTTIPVGPDPEDVVVPDWLWKQ